MPQVPPALAPVSAAPAVAAPVDAVYAARSRWGWLPPIVFVGALGLLAVGYAMRLALAGRSHAEWLFWLGLLLVYAPVALRMALPNLQRRERIALAVWLGLALYLVRVLRSPTGFIFHDEFPHYATANDILRTGSLFHVNSLQEVSAFFPGLEIVTAALASLSGLSIQASGMIVIGAARLIAALGIYLLYEEVSGSPRVAGVGSVLAIAYPNYTFWSSQFSYESLALPMAVLVLLVGLWMSRRTAHRSPLIALAVLLILAVVITHHVTSYFLAAALAALFVASRILERSLPQVEQRVARLPRFVTALLPRTLWWKPSERRTEPRVWGALALTAGVSALLWLVTSGREVLGYLTPHLVAATRGLAALFVRPGEAHRPFTTSGGPAAAPALEQMVAFGAVLLLVAVIPFGLLQVWRRYRHHGLAVLFALASLAYPFTLVLRLAGGGSEIANRSWDFLFVALGFVLATAVAELWMAQGRALPRATAFAVYACIAYVGAFVVGMPGWARLPGPYLVGGDTRGLQPESYALADWGRTRLGPDNRFIADSTNKLLLGAYGEQYIVDGLSWVYVSPKLAPADELADLVNRDAQYVVVDRRVTQQLPRQGFYFEEGEPNRNYSQPFELDRLLKFEREPCLSRVFDSGHIAVYAVGVDCARAEGGSR